MAGTFKSNTWSCWVSPPGEPIIKVLLNKSPEHTMEQVNKALAEIGYEFSNFGNKDEIKMYQLKKREV